MFPVGVTTVTYTATDVSGNSTSQSFTVRVLDKTNPIISGMPASITGNNSGGTCGRTVSWTPPTATDDCPGAVQLTASIPPGSVFPIGVTTVTYTATDVAGNEAKKSFTVTVLDKTNPIISGMPASITVNNSGGTCGRTVTWTPPTATDICPGAVQLTASKAPGSMFPVGVTTVTYTATDVAGNEAKKSFTVTVLDKTNPVISGIPVNAGSICANGLCESQVTWTQPTATDDCGISSFSSNFSSGSFFPAGKTRILYTAIDLHGNVDTVGFWVEVKDTQAPIMTNMPANAVIYSSNACNASFNWTPPVATDNCTPSPTVTGSLNSGHVFPLGITSVTYTATDASGNTSQASFTVTVADTSKPVIATPANLTKFAAFDSCSATFATITPPMILDSCGQVPMQFGVRADNLALNAPYPVGTTLIIWMAMDQFGNFSTPKVQSVIVVDTIAPRVTTPLDSVVYVNQSSCAYYWEDWRSDLGAIDNCGQPTITSSSPQSLLLSSGVHLINYTLSDANGNSRQYQHRVRVADTVSPQLTNIPANITAYAASNCQANVAWTNPTSSDNCTNSILTSSHQSGGAFGLGVTPVQYVVTDASGNQRTGSFTVTVLDTVKPVIPAQASTLVLDAQGQATLSLSQVLGSAGITDNCGVLSFGLNKTAFTCADLGANSVIITAFDVNGNVSMVPASVTVLDTIKPVIAAKSATLVLDALGQATLSLGQVLGSAGITDNCGVLRSGLSKTAFTCADLGVNTVTISATDVNGNMHTTTATVTVVDQTAPIVVTQPATLYLNSAGSATLTSAAVNGGGTADNCGVSAFSLSKSSFGCADVGVNTVTLSASDASGNVMSANASVVVRDTIKPVIPAQSAAVLLLVLDPQGQAGLNVSQVLGSASITDNCGVLSAVLSKTAFTCADLGPHTLTITATDIHGNVSKAFRTITVVDQTVPNVVTQPATLYLNSAGLATLTSAAVTSSTADICGVVSFSLSKSSFGCADVGANTVTLSASDASGNVGTAATLVTVLDTIRPTLSLGSDTLVGYLTSNQCSLSVNLSGVTAADACGANVNFSPASGSVFNVGITPVAVTATDPSGNQRLTTMYVDVRDTLSPVLLGVPVNVSVMPVVGSCSATVTWVAPSAVDNCSAVVTASAQSGTVFSFGTHTVTWTATDLSGNTRTASLSFTISDQEPPSLSAVPSNQTHYVSATQCHTVVSWPTITTTDNCGTASVTTSSVSGSAFGPGITNVTVIAVDANGISATAAFSVTVLDTVKPVWTSVPQNMNQGACSAAVYFAAPTATDNCTNVTVVQIAGYPSGSVYPVGTTTNTFTATDASGNVTITSFTVTIHVSAFTYTPSQTAYCIQDTLFNLMPAGVTNLTFSGSGISGNHFFNPFIAGLGNHSITYEHTDIYGCKKSGTFVLTVQNLPNKPAVVRMTSTVLKVSDGYSFHQWYRNGEPISGANQSSYVVRASGSYGVAVGNGGICTNVSDPFFMGLVGEEELEPNELRVYPNPTSGLLILAHSLPLEEVQSVQIIDKLGREVYRAPIHADRTTLDLSGLAQGTYLVVLHASSNVLVKPIIIQQ